MQHLDFKDLSDDQLLLYLKEGNHMAFQSIYNKYWERSYRNVYNVLYDKGLSEDVLHEVFSDMWFRKDTIDIRNLKAYLFKSVRNNALLKIRSEKFVALNADMIEGLVLKPDIEMEFDQKELKRTIEQIMKQLPARCRAIFYMSRFQDCSISEIAVHFGISHRTVENQIHLALKHLRTNLGIAIFLVLFS
ncbi:RNA polymerase sigma-70 factor [Confluentibacter sediminis]|uniref:RNA polymerase sigma-70 factor n=1 Tax=Confluentibacter sediminis TaxID=2219045 RepID=UPI000DADA26E|nr:RNA polymerase sigma-70 factor [Confluentibacter sediminis]